MKIKIKIPQSWNALSQDQIFKITKLITNKKQGLFFDYKCFLILINYNWYNILQVIKVHFILSQLPLSELKKEFNYIFQDCNLTKFPDFEAINKTQFHKPFDRLANLTVDEFAIADDLHIKFRQTNNHEYLYYLAATLYSRSQQPRAIFDKNNIEVDKDFFKKIPIHKLLAIDFAFFGSKEYMSKKFPKCFPKATVNKSKKQNAPSSSGWSNVVLKMAGGKFGNHLQTKQTNIYTFLTEFEELLKAKK